MEVLLLFTDFSKSFANKVSWQICLHFKKLVTNSESQTFPYSSLFLSYTSILVNVLLSSSLFKLTSFSFIIFSLSVIIILSIEKTYHFICFIT